MAEYHPLRTADQCPTTESYARLNADAERRARECRSARMPSLRHLTMRDYDLVYEPSDDTYLIIDAIGSDVDATERGPDGEGGETARSSVRTTLEIGCGTGVPSVYLAMRLRGLPPGDRRDDEGGGGSESAEDGAGAAGGRSGPLHYATDINPNAIRAAMSTADENGIPPSDFRTFRCDLASDLLDELGGRVDVLIFNPPYVPTPDEEVGSEGIEASWAGGTDGRVVLDRALPQIARLLAHPHGVAYVVVVDDNYPEQLARTMAEAYGIKAIPWLRRRARNEFLTILKMTPTREFRSEQLRNRLARTEQHGVAMTET